MFNLVNISDVVLPEEWIAPTTDVQGERIGIVKCDMTDFFWF